MDVASAEVEVGSDYRVPFKDGFGITSIVVLRPTSIAGTVAYRKVYNALVLEELYRIDHRRVNKPGEAFHINEMFLTPKNKYQFIENPVLRFLMRLVEVISLLFNIREVTGETLRGRPYSMHLLVLFPWWNKKSKYPWYYCIMLHRSGAARSYKLLSSYKSHYYNLTTGQDTLKSL